MQRYIIELDPDLKPPFKCLECNKSFSFKRNLKRYILRIHKQQKRFRRFIWKQQYYQHVLSDEVEMSPERPSLKQTSDR